MAKVDKKIIVDVDITFMKCPNKRHKAETCLMTGGFDGFIKVGCSCAAKLLLEAVLADELKRKKKKK